MRVDRALERFQALLAKRGITSTHSALTAGLIACAIVSAPLGLAASISAHVIGSATVVAATKATLLKSSVTAKKVILASMTAVLVLGTIGSIHFIRTHRAFAKQIHRWFMR